MFVFSPRAFSLWTLYGWLLIPLPAFLGTKFQSRSPKWAVSVNQIFWMGQWPVSGSPKICGLISCGIYRLLGLLLDPFMISFKSGIFYAERYAKKVIVICLADFVIKVIEFMYVVPDFVFRVENWYARFWKVDFHMPLLTKFLEPRD